VTRSGPKSSACLHCMKYMPTHMWVHPMPSKGSQSDWRISVCIVPGGAEVLYRCNPFIWCYQICDSMISMTLFNTAWRVTEWTNCLRLLKSATNMCDDILCQKFNFYINVLPEDGLCTPKHVEEINTE
jgi:hypothetical protein